MMMCIDKNSIWETVLRAYPSWVQIWGAFWLPELQTATLWSPLVSLWWTSTDSQYCNIFIFPEYLLTGRSRLLFNSLQLSHQDTPPHLPSNPASPSDVESHPARERRGLCYTDHPDWLYQLIFPWHHAGKLWQNADDLQTRGTSPEKWKNPILSIVSGRRSKDFFFFALIWAVARVLNLDLLTLKCLRRSNGHVWSTSQIAD